MIIFTHGIQSIAGECQSTKRPYWLIIPKFESTCYYGINSAQFNGNQKDYDTIQKAKDRSIMDLSYSLSANIQSYFEEYLSEYEDDEVKSSLMLSSRLVLDGIQEKDAWLDCQHQTYWMMVSIDKHLAENQVRNQNFINQVLDRLKHRQGEVKKGVQFIAELLNQRTQRIDNYLGHIKQLSVAIEHKLASNSKHSGENYRKLIQRINTMCRLFNRFNHTDDQRFQKINEKQAILMNELITVSSTIQSDYFLSFVSDDIVMNNRLFRIQIKPSKGQGAEYFAGERIFFTVNANRNCYIKVMYIQSTGEETILLPNVYDRNNYVKAGQPVIVGKLGELMVLAPFGQDTITVVASETPFTDLDDQLNIAARSKQHYLTQNLPSPSQTVRIRVGDFPLNNSIQLATDTCIIYSIHKKLPQKTYNRNEKSKSLGLNITNKTALTNISGYKTKSCKSVFGPSIKVFPTKGKRGTVFNIIGSDFSLNKKISLYLIYPNNKNNKILQSLTNSDGTYQYSWSSENDSKSGIYSCYLVDNEKSITTTNANFIVWIDGPPPKDVKYGIFARTVDNPEIYWIKFNKKFLIKNEFDFNKLGFHYSDIQWYGNDSFNTIPKSNLLYTYTSEEKSLSFQNLLISELFTNAINKGLINFHEANLKGVNLSGKNLKGIDLREANLEGANLKKVNLEGSCLEKANLKGANLTDSNLIRANLSGAELTLANLMGADLQNANLTNTIIKETIFLGANLKGTILEKKYSKTTLNTKKIDTMDDAITAYSSPKSMILKETAIVNLLIHFNKSKEELVNILIEEKRKKGLEISNFQYESDKLKASGKMKALLKGHSFEIAEISEPIQAMTLEDVTEWKWQIKALKKGFQSLHLSISAIFEINGKEERKTFRTYDRIIEVKVQNTIKYFISTNWYWLVSIITTITGIFLNMAYCLSCKK